MINTSPCRIFCKQCSKDDIDDEHFCLPREVKENSKGLTIKMSKRQGKANLVKEGDWLGMLARLFTTALPMLLEGSVVG